MAGYRVPDWRKSIGQNDTTFTLTMDDGTEYVLPKGEWLETEYVELLGRVGELGVISVFNTICPPVLGPEPEDGGDRPVVRAGLGEAFRHVPQKFVNEFLRSWQQDAAIEPGESEASGDS